MKMKDNNNGFGYEYIIKYKELESTEEKVEEGWWNYTNDIDEVKDDFLKHFLNATITYIALWTDEECKKYHQEQINKGFAQFLGKVI